MTHAWVTGANTTDRHVCDAVCGRDFTVDIWADLVTVVPGDARLRCGRRSPSTGASEVGHLFQIGT